MRMTPQSVLYQHSAVCSLTLVVSCRYCAWHCDRNSVPEKSRQESHRGWKHDGRGSDSQKQTAGEEGQTAAGQACTRGSRCDNKGNRGGSSGNKVRRGDNVKVITKQVARVAEEAAEGLMVAA